MTAIILAMAGLTTRITVRQSMGMDTMIEGMVAGNPDADSLKRHLTQLTDLNLERQENDNITAVTVKYIKENSVG